MQKQGSGIDELKEVNKLQIQETLVRKTKEEKILQQTVHFI